MQSQQFTKVHSCRACGSKNITLPVLKKSYYLMNLDQTVELGYAACQDCLYIFQAEYVGDEFLASYYAKSPMLRRAEPTVYDQNQNERQATFLSRSIPLNGLSVLEIGANSGAFLVHLQKTFDCQTYFDELSEEACLLLGGLPGLHNIRNTPSTKVDLVILRHVLEHVHDLPAFFSHIQNHLNSSGVLFVEVPDWSHLDKHTDPLIFEHLSQFNTFSFLQLMRRMGWECEALEKGIHTDDPTTPNRIQRAVFRRAALPLGSPLIGPTFLEFYNNHEGFAAARINEILRSITPDKKIALYPASHLTFTAMSETNLLERNVIGIFDIDSKKHGRVIRGLTVNAPSALAVIQPDYIFLFTMAFEPEIRESFRQMDLKAKVISISQLIAESDNHSRVGVLP